DSHVIVAAHAVVDKFDDHFLPDAFNVAIAPGFKRERGGLAAAFFHGALISAAGGVSVNLIRRSKHDVHPAAVGLPAGDAGGIMLVGICDAPVMLFFKFVLVGVGSGVAALPERLDELVALFVVGELHEGATFVVGNDPAHVLVQPLAVCLAQLDFEGLGVSFFLFF